MTTETPPEEPKSDLANNAAIYFVGQIISWTVTLLTITVVARHFGADGIGKVATASAYPLFVCGLMTFSIETYLVKEFGRDREHTKTILEATLGLRLALLIPTILLALGLMSLITLQARPGQSLFTILRTDSDAQLSWMLALPYVLAIIPYHLAYPLVSVLTGWKRAKLSMIAATVNQSLPIILTLILLKVGLLGMAWSYFVALIVYWVIGFYGTRDIGRITPRIDWGIWRSLIRNGMPIHINVLLAAGTPVVAVWFLKKYGGDTAVGVYNQAGKLSGTTLFIATALSTALLPIAAKMAETNAAHLRAIQTKIFSLLLVVGLPVTLYLFLLSDSLVKTLYGNRFPGLELTLKVAVCTIIPVSITSVYYQLLVATNKTRTWTRVVAFNACLNLVGWAVLVPFCQRTIHNASVGAFIPTLAAEIISAPIMLWMLRTNPFQKATLLRLLKVIAATTLMSAAMLLARKFGFLAEAAVGGAVLFVAGLALGVLSDEEKQRLFGLLSKFTRKFGVKH